MKKEYLSILCCPYCHDKLGLDIEKEENDEIIKGTFTCKQCNKTYEIKDGIPTMI